MTAPDNFTIFDGTSDTQRSLVDQLEQWHVLPSTTGAGRGRGNPMGIGHVEYHSVPEIVINCDGPEERRIAFVDDFGGTMELSTQQLRNLITLPVSEDFWQITGLC